MYPGDWNTRQAKRYCLDRVGNKCQKCGARDRSRKKNKGGEWFTVHLARAHKKQYTSWQDEAEVLVLCQSCHREFDNVHNKRKSRYKYLNIGLAKVMVDDRLVECCRTYAELNDVIQSLPVGTRIEVLLTVNQAIVGNALYTRTEAGIEIDGEYGVAEYLFMVLEGEKANKEEQQAE